ncbi:MAG: fatty acid desaturase, partial [Myxococcota bacterium]
PTLFSWAKFIVTASLGVGLVLSCTVLPWWGALVALPLASLSLTTAAMMGHEAAHGASCESARANAWLEWLAFPLLSGLSTRFWRHKHNRVHHGMPNVVGKDGDLEMWPLAIGAPFRAREGTGLDRFQRHLQGIALWPLSLLLSMGMRGKSFRFLAQQVVSGKRTSALALDIGLLAVHYTAWLVIPSFFVHPLYVVGTFAAVWGMVGGLLTAIFIVGHTGMPLVSDFDNRWVLQVVTSRNIRTGVLGQHFFVGLDHQIEHHLFPTIPHLRMPLAASIIRPFLEERGIPYAEAGWGSILVEVTGYMSRAWTDTPKALVAGHHG